MFNLMGAHMIECAAINQIVDTLSLMARLEAPIQTLHGNMEP